MVSFVDDFDGRELDTEVWVPHYLPMWSSRAETAASYTVAGSELRLTIPPEHGLWCADQHEPPLRVSGIQSGVFSKEVGSTGASSRFATASSYASTSRGNGAGRRATACSRFAPAWS